MVEDVQCLNLRGMSMVHEKKKETEFPTSKAYVDAPIHWLE